MEQKIRKCLKNVDNAPCVSSFKNGAPPVQEISLSSSYYIFLLLDVCPKLEYEQLKYFIVRIVLNKANMCFSKHKGQRVTMFAENQLGH